MFTTTNGLHVMIAGEVARTASASIDPNSAAYIADGEVVIVDAGGTVLDTTTVLTRDEVRIAQRSGDQIYYSPMIKGTEIKKYIGSAYTTDVEQVSFVGYNGATGALEEITDNDYLLRVIRKDSQATVANKHMLKFGAYRTGATAAQSDIAIGLAASLIANFAREPETEAIFEAVCNDAGAAITGTGTITVNHGSKIVTAGTDVDAVVAAGDFIRLGSTDLDGGVYKIISLDTTAETMTLDRPFEGASLSADAEANTEFITAVLGAAANWGVKLTGVARKFEVGSFKFSKVRFDITLADFGSAVVTHDTAASEGNGTWEIAQELEWFASQGSKGKIARIGTPSPVFKQDVASGKSFSTLSIAFSDKSYAGIQGTPESKMELMLLLDKGVEGAAFGGQVAGAASDIVDVLDAWIVAKGTGSAQTGNI